MRQKLAPFLMLIALLVWGCNPSGSGNSTVPGPQGAPSPVASSPTGPSQSSDSSQASPSQPAADADPSLNPHVTVPLIVKVSPDLAQVAAPAGWLSQAEIQAKALAALSANSGSVGTFTLTSIQPDTANGFWIVEFATDGRQVSGVHSHPAPVNLPQDPVARRKAATSDTYILSAVTYAFDGHTGEARGGGFKSGAPDPNRTDLEHYRGRIVEAGMNLTLRLTRADGSREGRDLNVWIPPEALGNQLALWQLQYGVGRQLDVWGLTSGPNTVTAYRLAMVDPPAEELLQNELIGGVPLYPSAVAGPDAEGWANLTITGVTADQVRDWYAKEMPKYGYHPQDGVDSFPGDSSVRYTFRNDAWEQEIIEITPLPTGTRIRLNRTTLL